MKFRDLIVAVAGLVLSLMAAHAQAAEIRVLASTAVKATLEEVAPQFTKATGNKIDLTFAPASALRDKIEQGTAFDVAVLTTPIVDDLAGSGKVERTHTAIAHSGIGVAILKGAAKPDISTKEAFKQALLNAKTIGFTAGGATGAYLNVLFNRLDIAERLQPKLKPLQGGVGDAVTSGQVEIGMTQISEILPYPGAELAGPLPLDIQSFTYFSAAVSAASKETAVAKAFIKFLEGPEALAVLKAKGMEPG